MIVGGGYHGKSTLLGAIQRGVYAHIPGDGREYVATLEDAMKVRAADGRAVTGVDVSSFITHLPGMPTQRISPLRMPQVRHRRLHPQSSQSNWVRRSY